MPQYIQGVDDPTFKVDAGSGDWCTTSPPTREAINLKDNLELLTSDVVRFFRPDAVSHLEHYLGNTGSDYSLNMADLIKKSEQLRKCYNDELEQAKRFCEELGAGHHNITSSEVRRNDFAKENNSNLFYAIGGYQYWGKGSVEITVIRQGGPTYNSSMGNYYASPLCRYDLNFVFILFDRYNWNIDQKDAGVRLGGLIPITDVSMGQLHKECLAREYNLWGIIKQRVTWEDKE